ncbi:MAG: hypothetical protein AB8F78_02360 [Saprospiraceae bacterium]
MKLLHLCSFSAFCLISAVQTDAQVGGSSIATLFDSMATEAHLHRGPIGEYGAYITTRSLWLDTLIERRAAWFHIDSLASPRPTTRAVTLICLDPNNKEQYFSAYAKTLGDTARLWVAQENEFNGVSLGDFAYLRTLELFADAVVPEVATQKRELRRDSILFNASRISGSYQLLQLIKMYGTDTSAAADRIRRMYQMTDENDAFERLMEFGDQQDTVFLIDRLTRSDEETVQQALYTFDPTHHSRYLSLVRPTMLRLAPSFGQLESKAFYSILFERMQQVSKLQAEPLLQDLEAVLSELQRARSVLIRKLRETWK